MIVMSLYLTVDGHVWEVERRYEMERLMTRATQREYKLFLFFNGPGGELRRSEIPEGFAEEPAARILETVWRYAEVVRPAAPGEMTSQAELTMPTFRNAIKLLWRAIRLRCPNCGGKGILKSWLTLKYKCPTCGLRFERGEASDYYLGGMLFNLILSELLFAVAFTIALIVMWPNVPWDGLEYTLVAAVVLAPIVLYPLSRVLWLAFDLMLRPATPEEMAWHAQSDESGPE
jgi:uncharacterized protein (DUF983 family)